MLHIDLFNFEEPFASNSKYVITSPRSLEACARYGIKPVELLHRPLSYFENENSSYGTAMDPNAVYQEYERHRLRKLRLCREERERLVREEEWSFLISDEHTTSTPTPKTRHHYRTDISDQNHTESPSLTTEEAIRNRPMDYSHSMMPTEATTNAQNTIFTNRSGIGGQLLSDRAIKGNAMQKLQPGIKSDERKDMLETEFSCQRSKQKKPQTDDEKEKHRILHQEIRKNRKNMAQDNVVPMQHINLQKQKKECLDRERKPTSKGKANDHYRHRNERLDAARMEIQAKFDRWKSEFEKNVHHRNAEMLARKVAEEERKLHQEAKRQEQELELELARRTEHVQVSTRRKEARELKDYLRLQRQLDIQARNEDEREKHELQMEMLEKENRRREWMMRREIMEKQEMASRNAQKIIEERQRETSENRFKDEERRALQQEQLASMEKDMKRWQNELIQYQQQSLERAKQIAESNTREKSIKAFEQRIQKEMDHALNKSKVDDEESLKREEIIMNIEMKNKRSEIVAEDRHNFIKTCRETALASSAIRESLRERSIKSSFDKMAQEADLLARLDRHPNMH